MTMESMITVKEVSRHPGTVHIPVSGGHVDPRQRPTASRVDRMTVRLAIVGDLNPTYPSHRELEAARGQLGPDVESVWIGTADPRIDHLDALGVDAVWLAPGSPYADDAAVLRVIQWARETGIPFLATCGGMQYAVIEFARNVLGQPATHAEVDGESIGNAVAPLACSLQGEERVVTPAPGTRFWQLTGGQPFVGTHYCSYGPTPEAIDTLTRYGWVIEASAPDAPVEVFTLWNHPFFVLTLFQPQIGALSGAGPHPLLHAFVGVARSRAQVRETAAAAEAEHARLAAAEREPRTYVHQMRGPKHRWWRPIAAISLGTVIWAVLLGLLSAGFAVTGNLPDMEVFAVSPSANLFMNLMLAALIPGVLIGLRVGHGRPAGRVFSVTGRLRWGWLMRLMAVITPLWAAYLAISWFVFGQEVLPSAKQWLGLTVVTLLTTPLQAAAEEITFRGGLVQSIGSWFRSPVVAFVVTTVISTATFALAHGSLDPWILIDLGALAVAACYLSWRTGGLEAGIALHVVNNLLITFVGIAFGGLEESYVDTGTTGDPISALMSVVAMTIATLVILWLAKRRGITRPGWMTPVVG